MTFIDTAIQSRENLEKKKKTEENSYFSDDGFMIGVCYLLKLFNADKKFESLSWFPSVIEEYRKQYIQRKSNKSSQGVIALDMIQINDYLRQFELQYFTYTSASILFTE